MGNEFPGEILGSQYAGYIFKITGGNDKDGFSMRQGILKAGRVRILMAKGQKCFRPRRTGERKRKSVRGCIVGKDICVLALSIVKHGDQPIVGITDISKPRKLGPKRLSKIRKLYSLEKNDNPKKFVVRRPTKSGKTKSPKIQRLVTHDRVRRKKVIRKVKMEKLTGTHKAMTDYKKLVQDIKKHKHAEQEKAEAKAAKVEKKVEKQAQPEKKTEKKGKTAK